MTLYSFRQSYTSLLKGVSKNFFVASCIAYISFGIRILSGWYMHRKASDVCRMVVVTTSGSGARSFSFYLFLHFKWMPAGYMTKAFTFWYYKVYSLVFTLSCSRIDLLVLISGPHGPLMGTHTIMRSECENQQTEF